ncbi:MAG: hypothetical protein RLZZ77_596 [Bacteroidota bacterium]|jgi:hypothetical protein
MKKLTVALFAFAFLLFSCKKDNSVSVENMQKTVTKGSWKATTFTESGTNQLSDISGYVFTFDDNGTLKAVKSGVTITGTWTVGEGSGDDSESHIQLNINFTTDPLTEIADDWHVLSVNSSKVELEDVSGGNGGTDELVLEKK